MVSVWIIIARSPIFVYLRDNAVPIRAKWGAEKMAMDAAGQKVQGAFGLRSSSIVMPALLICASLGTVVLSATTAVAQATSCQITTSSCPANPQYSGITWSDTYNGDNINQGACMARPASIDPWCGSPAGGNVTASFISGEPRSNCHRRNEPTNATANANHVLSNYNHFLPGQSAVWGSNLVRHLRGR